MRPFDTINKYLPQQAGKAMIRWITGGFPGRNGSTIVLPLEEDADFIPLKGGEQFVYLRNSPSDSFRKQVFFGGTDENPFLVELHPSAEQAVLAVAEYGEDSFYNYLKPMVVKKLESLLGVQARRQGDIFAVKVPWVWKEMRAFASLIWLDIEGDEKKSAELNIFRTRHVLKGEYFNAVTYHPKRDYYDDTIVHRTLFASGVIEAPNHSPLILDGIHAISQVEVLARPEEAH